MARVRPPLVAAVAAACARLAGWAGGPYADACAAAARVAADHPGDLGVVALLLMRHEVLQPGQAVFMPAGGLHAYLRGTGIELLANSDNVVRSGLTGKHIDVPELLKLLDPSVSVPVLAPRLADGIAWFDTPAPEFRLYLLDLPAPVATPPAPVPPPGPPGPAPALPGPPGPARPALLLCLTAPPRPPRPARRPSCLRRAPLPPPPGPARAAGGPRAPPRRHLRPRSWPPGGPARIVRPLQRRPVLAPRPAPARPSRAPQLLHPRRRRPRPRHRAARLALATPERSAPSSPHARRPRAHAMPGFPARAPRLPPHCSH